MSFHCAIVAHAHMIYEKKENLPECPVTGLYASSGIPTAELMLINKGSARFMSSVVAFCLSTLLWGCSACNKWSISNISDQQAVHALKHPASEWTSMSSRRFTSGEYLHVNEDWIFFPFSPPLSASHLTLNLWWDPSVPPLTLNQKRRNVVPLKWKAETARSSCPSFRPDITRKAVRCYLELIGRCENKESCSVRARFGFKCTGGLTLVQSHQAPELGGGQVNCSI